MHGNEATATAALLDIFNFLASENKEFSGLRQTILENTSLYFIPMLNPDGAARFKRRNSLGIDLNRDALRLASPESKFLKSVRDSLQADWGFNLHDQNRRYAAGPKGNVATITLLAPPIDVENSVNEVRKDAMQLVVGLNRELQQFIPNGVGKWSDEFEARAFGENMQIWGTRTVLIESGGFGTDWEKQEVRRLNFVSILSGLYSIATESYQKNPIDEYYTIPENDQRYFDLLIRNATIESPLGLYYKADMGIDWEEEELPGNRYYNVASVEDWGDLSTFKGFVEFNAEGLTVQAAKIAPAAVNNLSDITADHVKAWLQAGYTGVVVKNLPAGLTHSPFPINLHAIGANALEPGFNQFADFVLKKDDTIVRVAVNGYLINPSIPDSITGQGRVFY
jgi:hypothetical protein